MSNGHRLACLLTTIILFLPTASAVAADELNSDSLHHYAQLREGNWSVTGQLKKAVRGLPAGMKYAINSTAHWSPHNNNFMTEWTWLEGSKEVVARGASYMYWDDMESTIIDRYNGVLGDNIFRGMMRLHSIDGRSYVWHDTEILEDGTSKHFITTDMFPDPNTWQRSIVEADKSFKSTGKELTNETWTRDNPLLDGFPNLSMLIGDWEWSHTNAFGEKVVDKMSWSFGPEKRSLKVKFTETGSDGTTRYMGEASVWYDPGDQIIRLEFIGIKGAAVSGTASDFNTSGDTTSWIWQYHGHNSVGEPMSGQQKITLTDNKYAWHFVTVRENGQEVPADRLNMKDRIFTKVQ